MRGDLRSGNGWMSEWLRPLLARFVAEGRAEIDADVVKGLDEDPLGDAVVAASAFDLPMCGFLNLAWKDGRERTLVLGLDVGVWG